MTLFEHVCIVVHLIDSNLLIYLNWNLKRHIQCYCLLLFFIFVSLSIRPFAHWMGFWFLFVILAFFSLLYYTFVYDETCTLSNWSNAVLVYNSLLWGYCVFDTQTSLKISKIDSYFHSLLLSSSPIVLCYVTLENSRKINVFIATVRDGKIFPSQTHYSSW